MIIENIGIVLYKLVYINRAFVVLFLLIDEKEYFASIDQMAEDALKDTCTLTNPRVPTKEEIVELYKNKEEGTPLFAFEVTMQNHGGYTNENFDADIQLEEIEDAAINQYLSLMKISPVT